LYAVGSFEAGAGIEDGYLARQRSTNDASVLGSKVYR
jgi:hypothetical protein